MPKIGEINKLNVLRETDIGFMLNERSNEIFLHKNESNHLDLKANDQVDAFLYYDEKKRLAATLKTPLITESSFAFLKVVSVIKNLGVFLDMGISKDLLLSKDDLPYDYDLWPLVGDSVYVSLNIKNNRFVAKMVNPTLISSVPNLELNTSSNFNVLRIGESGINLIDSNLNLIFVHNSMYRGKYRLGEEVSVKIINETDKGFTGSLIEQKEQQMDIDSITILKYLERNKEMPITAKSSSEEVSKYFEMSRKAFKRALGTLYKQNKVKFDNDKTIIVNGDKNE